MCEANAYIIKGEEEELFLAKVDKIIPHEDGLMLESIFGQKKYIKGKIIEMALLDHKIIIEEMETLK